MERFEKIIRIAIVLVILLAGLALVPYIELPVEALTWQLYAGVYEATLTVNHPNGSPGSYFLFTGANYPPDSTAIVSINGSEAGEVTTDSNGNLSFIVATANSIPGSYTVSATVDVNASAADNFVLDNNAPFRPKEGDGPVISLTPTIYFPVVEKE